MAAHGSTPLPISGRSHTPDASTAEGWTTVLNAVFFHGSCGGETPSQQRQAPQGHLASSLLGLIKCQLDTYPSVFS